MADYTPNKKLELPKSNEHYDVGVANKNNRVIDSELHKLDLKNQSQDELLATKDEVKSGFQKQETRIDNEIKRAQGIENELSNNIANEINRAVQTETNILGELKNHLPITGGAITSDRGILDPVITLIGSSSFSIIDLKSTSGAIRLQESSNESQGHYLGIYDVSNDVVELLKISKKIRHIYDYKTNSLKEILVHGDSIIPTVKETILKTSTGDLTVYGVTGNTETDITDIFNKANTMNEGMRLGISPANGMGYIQSQNFNLNCALLTEEERKLLQSFTNIHIQKENNSNDYPILRPEIFNFCAETVVIGQNGRIPCTAKVQIKSTENYNYFSYELPMDFRNDDFSKNVLTLHTKEWLVATGIDIKNRT